VSPSGIPSKKPIECMNLWVGYRWVGWMLTHKLLIAGIETLKVDRPIVGLKLSIVTFINRRLININENKRTSVGAEIRMNPLSRSSSALWLQIAFSH
jgi:hypothetical protein